VAFVTYAEFPLLYDDDKLPAGLLRHRGVDVEVTLWDSREVRWEEFDAVVLRSCWEYHLRTQEFLDWIALMEQRVVRLWNSPAVVRENIDKHYLKRLADEGVPVAPTVLLEPGSDFGIAAILEEHGWPQAVIKPAVSMSAYRTWITDPSRAASDERKVREMLSSSGVLIQRFIPEVRTRGEWSLVFFMKEYSHAVLKMPNYGDFRTQRDFGGRHVESIPPRPLVEQAQRIISKVKGPLLYARVDGVEVGGELMLMELELIDPVLFFSHCDSAAERFADAVERVARRTNL
jgi:glutathione synthase/RimK-type ligase-like ATP-grasp enzyme